MTRWPGTIQPSRFLSHTGQVLPGVRRVVNVPNPAIGEDWSATVPGGVQWTILSGVATLVTDDVDGNRVVSMSASIDGVVVSLVPSPDNPSASATLTFSIVTDAAIACIAGPTFIPTLVIPFDAMPPGTVFGSSTATLDAGDQWQDVNVWIEELYFTDAQLSEDQRLRVELERDIAVYEYEQAEQSRGAT